MFGLISKKKYDRMMSRAVLHHHLDLQCAISEYEKLLARWNALIKKINAKGGDAFLEHGRIVNECEELTLEDVKFLIRHCHPDRNGGGNSFNVITAKLNNIKARMEKNDTET